MTIRRFDSPHRIPGRHGLLPRAIVIHTARGTFEGTAGWFCDGSSGVSAHYLVGLDGTVGTFVPEEDGARHVATGDANLWTIGVEFEDAGAPDASRPARQYRSGARLVGRIAERWGFSVDERHVLPHSALDPTQSCPAGLDIGRLIRTANEPGPLLACLVPVRNGEADLPAYLESVSGFADAVVALDDGSTDRTREVLEAHPLVDLVISNPPRPSYAGWDDARNRNRLLDAAAEVGPEWVLFLDADERIAEDDASALRTFVERDALPGCAYGLQHHRMWGDAYDPEVTLVYRLFAYEPGQWISGPRLHFDPVPATIDRARWLPTTIRLRHLSDAARIESRRQRYRDADPDDELAQDDDLLAERPEQVATWEPRPPDLPVLMPIAAPETVDGPLVCLLPVRNGEEDLPGYLASASRFADAVVALDDGSTDRTRELLERHPLVEVVIANPPRPTYEGWDDARNRNRLLEAATKLEPGWVLFLDADERIAPDDAEALRRFVERDALSGYAYQLRVHRMVGRDRFDRADLFVARLFAFEPGMRLEGDALHLPPVPVNIPPARWVRTTLRIQHLAALTPERRSARFRKYREADPDGTFQSSYEHLLDAPGDVRRWRPRPMGLAVVPRGAARRADRAEDLSGPVLSAVVIAHDDERTITGCVRSVVEQEVPEPFEVIVVAGGTDRTAEVTRRSFPDVTVVETSTPALPGAARNAGVAVARGDFVSFPGSHVTLPPGSLAARVRAHERGHPMVTGTVHNGTPTASGWASYFLDHSGSLPGRPSGLLGGPPAHCSYARDFLLQVGGFPEDLRAGEDTVVNHRLYRLGYRAYRAAAVELFHRSPCTDPLRLIAHHFRRGRALSRVLAADGPRGEPLLANRAVRRLYMTYVPTRLRATSENVRRWGGPLAARYRRVYPLVVVGAVAAWAGAWFELAAAVRSRGWRSAATSPKQLRR